MTPSPPTREKIRSTVEAKLRELGLAEMMEVA